MFANECYINIIIDYALARVGKKKEPKREKKSQWPGIKENSQQNRLSLAFVQSAVRNKN